MRNVAGFGKVWYFNGFGYGIDVVKDGDFGTVAVGIIVGAAIGRSGIIGVCNPNAALDSETIIKCVNVLLS